jgi:hypothetical protein
MKNVTFLPEQIKIEQVKNEQPKKTWMEPELVILDIESGKHPHPNEVGYFHS